MAQTQSKKTGLELQCEHQRHCELELVAMLHIDGLVDNDRLPPHDDGAMLNHYGLRLIDPQLALRSSRK